MKQLWLLPAASPLPPPGTHMQGQLKGLQGAGRHCPRGKMKRTRKHYVSGRLGASALTAMLH